MMRPVALATILLMTGLVGCTAYPRYRTGGAERPIAVKISDNRLSTRDYRHLGLILQEYLGEPYRGKSMWRPGLDCSLFARKVFQRFNKMELPRTVRDQYRTGRQITRRLISFGDLVFFRTERDKVSHVGIYIGENEFIHASTSRGVIISSLREKYWAERYAGARRVLP